MSKSKNPTVGYLPCSTPGCGCVCTVHQVGAHKAATEGEAPKNKRRLGLYYTLCPKCGADQRSGAERQEFIKHNMVETEAEARNQTEPTAANDDVLLETVETEVVTENQTALTETDTQQATEVKPKKTVNPVLIGGFVALLIGAVSWLVKAKNKPQQTESNPTTQGMQS
ncbi:hypothetical protein [Thaumasiovibrio subtropicus]|uniref:hypothetical protein n=1 Tax=Thaumasiovibrio subtropicus TaxID=1891207 RepID=UPI000B355EB1|nr:hypothetical protein [Thaumasiovibrio subtropicus]